MTEVVDPGVVRRLDARTTRVRAANPSAMTLSGTNTYVVGDPSGGAVVVVDPGPALQGHRRAIEHAVADRDARIAAVVVTHHHADHAEAVGWAADWQAPAWACDPDRIPGAQPVDDGAVIGAGAIPLTIHHLPGHTADHLCVGVADTGVVLTGDHVLGEGTSVIAWPDGDLGAYLDSLRALRRLAPTALYPGHGEVVDDAIGRVDGLLAHRAQRTAQVVAALEAGAHTVDDIVARVYPDLVDGLRPAAARSVQAHLHELRRAGRASLSEGRWHGR